MCLCAKNEIEEVIKKDLVSLKKLHTAVVVFVIHRSSEAFYNYKLKQIWLYKRNIPYEDSDSIAEYHVTTGIYQDLTLPDAEEILKSLGFEKIWEC